MTNVSNNLIQINGLFSSKDFYEKNRIIKEKYMKKVPSLVDKGITKKQQLSDQRKDKKYKEANNNQFYNRKSKIKEKMFCSQDEIDLDQDFENELKVNQLVLDEIAAEEVHKARLALVETWLQALVKKAQEDDRYVTRSESEVLYFMEKHDVDPAQKELAEESLQGLIAGSKRYEWIDDRWHGDSCDSYDTCDSFCYSDEDW
jgi:hypothetical protein